MKALTDALVALLGPGDLCVTPWRSDGHPDHNATGSATLTAARTTHTPVLAYFGLGLALGHTGERIGAVAALPPLGPGPATGRTQAVGGLCIHFADQGK
jgi:LmbE family N-acetylglucosaminyl deacetylase